MVDAFGPRTKTKHVGQFGLLQGSQMKRALDETNFKNSGISCDLSRRMTQFCKAQQNKCEIGEIEKQNMVYINLNLNNPSEAPPAAQESAKP